LRLEVDWWSGDDQRAVGQEQQPEGRELQRSEAAGEVDDAVGNVLVWIRELSGVNRLDPVSGRLA
jgi:hypothetical protein